MDRPLRIAVDAMGGDHAPEAIVHGAVEACRVEGEKVEVVLVGDQAAIENELSRHFRVSRLPIAVVHADEKIEMGEAPAQAIRQKRNSSISVAMQLHRAGEVDAVVSAGNTGAVMAAALLSLGRMAGVQRPAIGVLLPSENGRVLLLDVGANAECKPAHLYQFGVMGSIFMSSLFDLPQPRVGLLNIGEEATKGSEIVQQAYRLLERSSLNFVGNVEGRDILRDAADVVVTDGFTGNVILKFGESFGKLWSLSLRRKIGKQVFRMLGAWLLKPTFRGLKEVFDYQQYGGAPLLGVRGTVIICHGKSTPKAIRNAIREARKMIEGRVNEKIAELLARWNGENGGQNDQRDGQRAGPIGSEQAVNELRS